MKKFDQQAIVDFVYKALIHQGKPSVNSTFTVSPWCHYRGKDGTKCAVGWLIPDTKNGIPEGLLIKRHYELMDYPYTSENNQFLQSLQRCHDTCKDFEGKPFKDKLRRNFKKFCAERNLKMPSALGKFDPNAIPG